MEKLVKAQREARQAVSAFALIYYWFTDQYRDLTVQRLLNSNFVAYRLGNDEWRYDL